ncbi:MAG: DUF483 domain-containing protein [Acidobacteria bacterium]|nr:DUF483 domain-containing protein [Acidobacteriota bacterium]
MNEPLASIRRLKGNSWLLPLYAAVLHQVRRSMDDWVPVGSLEEFKLLMNRLGMTVLEDCIFQQIGKQERVPGAESAPTTRARAFGIGAMKHLRGWNEVHVILSTKREWAEETLHAAWYPLAVSGGRILPRPKIDALRLGLAFGYPKCCVDSFQKQNDWKAQSQLVVTYRRSVVNWRVNCLTKHTPYMTVFHIPCSQDCAESIAMSDSVLEAVRSFDESYAKSIRDFLAGTFFVLNEDAIFKLYNANVLSERIVQFNGVENVIQSRPASRSAQAIEKILSEATYAEIQDGVVLTSNGAREYFYESSFRFGWFEDPFFVVFE